MTNSESGEKEIPKFKFLNLLDKKEKIKFFFIFLIMLVASLLELLSIGSLVPLIENLISNKNTEFIEEILIKYSLNNFSENFTTNMAFLVFIIFLVKNLFLLYLIWFRSKFTVYLKARWQEKLFNIYLSQEYIFHLKRNSSLLIRNIQQEINQSINSYLSPLLDFCLNMLIIILITLSLLFIYPITTIFVMIIFGFTALLLNIFVKKKIYKIGEIRQYTSLKMLQHMQEGFNNIVNVKLMHLKDFFLEKFNPHNFKMAKFGVRRMMYGTLPRICFEVIFITIVSASIIYAVKSQGSADILFSKLLIFVIASLRIIPALNLISNNYQKLRFGSPALELIYNEFNKLRIDGKQNKQENIKINSNIIISDLNFWFSNEKQQLFDSISFTIKKNKITGIVGMNGTGKTTLINLISGLLTPKRGTIKVNDYNIKDILKSWQNIIGFIPQDIYLIDDTIEANIALGIDKKYINKRKINYVMEITELNKEFDNNYIIGEKGKLLSGGQKQKIAISRAFYNDPELLIFDEPTSALDDEAEKNFIDNLIKKTDKTVILISHKKEPLIYCDNIFELANKKIIKVK